MKHLVKFNEGKFWDKMRFNHRIDKNLKKADIEVKKHLKKYLLKKFPFQYAVYIWKSNHENYEEIDVYDFEFIDLMVQQYFGDEVPSFYLYLVFVDKDGDKFAVDFAEHDPTERIGNLEYMKPWERGKNALRGAYMDQPDLEEKDYKSDKIYPNKNGSINLIPNSYETTEFLKDIKSTLKMINQQFKAM